MCYFTSTLLYLLVFTEFWRMLGLAGTSCSFRMNSQRYKPQCRDGSHKNNVGERVGIFKSIGPNLWISVKHKHNDSKLLLKVVFDETHSKQPKIHIGKSIPACGF